MNDSLTRAELEVIQSRCDAAASGPWTYDDYGAIVNGNENGLMIADVRGHGHYIGTCKMTVEQAFKQMDATGEFIAHSITDIPALLGEVERLTEQTQWIPVEERMPEKDDVDKYGYVQAWLPQGCARDTRPKDFRLRGVTHWMPLPKALKGVE